MLTCKQISKRYGSLEVLKGVDLEIAKGEIVSLVGSSGAGKSTLLHILGTLDEADGGTVEINGNRIDFHAKIKLQPVVWWKRLINSVVDSAMIALLTYPLAVLLSQLPLDPSIAFAWYWLFIFSGSVVYILYYLILEWKMGRTFGKFITGTKVATDNAVRPDFSTVLIRTLCRYIPFELFSHYKKFPKGWHDSFSSTIVIDSDIPYLNNQFSANEIALFRNKHIGFVFQFHHLLPEFTALENVCIPGWLGAKKKKEVETRAIELLKMLGLAERLHNKPSELSGGEQQRVAVARALINNPDIIMADEPTGNLDSTHARELHQLFFDLRKQFNQTFLIVTHNEELAAQCDRTVHMKDGRIVAGAN